MALHVDPEENEVRAMQEVAAWQGKRVLEIGCGEGRLTQRLARLGAKVHAIDPDAKLIRAARKNLPKKYAKQVTFKTGSAERLTHRDQSFDTAVFGWSL